MLTPTDTGYSFRATWLARGSIDRFGRITQLDKNQGPCPKCLPASAQIETPSGRVSIAALTVGVPVITLDARGARVIRPVISVGSVSVGESHRLIDIELDDGRHVAASARHPTIDDRTMDALRAGDRYDGAIVTRVRTVPYAGDRTFDIEVAGDTSAYFADGVPLGSTLRRGPRDVVR